MTPPRLLRRVIHAAWARVMSVAPRASCPYGSHIPIIVICCAVFKPQRVLELGTGNFSTPALLNRKVCPTLQTLRSIENDPQWFAQVCRQNGPDERWDPQLVSGPVWRSIRQLNIPFYDLILIDDSTEHISRSRTIQAVIASQPRCPVIIHDAESLRLRVQIWLRARSIVFDIFNPQTAVAFAGAPEHRLLLQQCRQMLRNVAAEGNSAKTLSEWIAVGLQTVHALHL